MSFDQNMIIDATTGSIARFVNHSCNPNCRMVKWIVGGNPRMALFAGDRPIMTGEELTYDYKFDPFSAKNVQTCLCGEPNCRGVLGPKPKSEVKESKDVGAAVKAGAKAGKRKLKEVLGEEKGSPKKRRVVAVKGTAKGAGKGKAGAKGSAGKGMIGKGKAKASPVKARKGAVAKTTKTAKPVKPALKKTITGRVRKTYARPKSEVQVKAKATARGSRGKVSVAVKETVKKSRVVSLSLKGSPKGKAAPAATPKGSPSKGKENGGSIVAKGDDAAPVSRSPVSKSGRVRKLTEKAMVEGA